MPRRLFLLLCLLLQLPGRAQDGRELALWKSIKRALLGPHGDEYFEMSMKNAMLPTLHGRVVSLEPAANPRTVVLAIEDGATPDATLRFDRPLPGKVEAGTELSFEGVAESYTANPFMVVFEVYPDHLHGWPDHSG